jgi:hypothetical protein
MDQPPIPPRSSSKSPTKGPFSSPTKRLRDLEDERRTINDMAKKARKRLKVAMSFDVQYWSTRHEVTEHELKATRLTKKISMAKMNTPAEEFFKSKEGRKLLLEESSLELDDKLYLSQAKAMDNSSRTFNLRRLFVGLFIGAETGLNLQNNLGQRDASLQSKFRNDLEVRMLSEHEDPDRTTLWCPITGQYWPRAATQAGHLFPYKSGQVHMDAIFGYIRDKDGMSELFKAENGILWSSETETRFSAGHFVIIPNVADDPTSQELIDWERSDPKQYKIRVLNPDDSTMKKKIQDTEVKWYQLNDQPVRFKGNFRPRARYLYFCYCTAMLRRALTGQHLEVSRSELRKRFWGTPGKYMRKSMLLGFVEQMGHDYDHLLEGAIHEDDAEAEFEGIAVANDHIKDTLKDPDEGDESEDDDDDEC